MSKGKLTGCCRTCGSEIVETVNDSVFRDGECDSCERVRYESQPDLVYALDMLLEATIDAERACGFELTEAEVEAEQVAKAALAKAYDKPSSIQ
ncbi:MAG TPA: hypothetical protein VFE46_13415 [Pirellulales bacterium]|jgi:hypothetical protein|nr:hypothetical protein [Pirellulales bacterium]